MLCSCQGSPSHFQVCISDRINFCWVRYSTFKTDGKKHSEMKTGGSQMLVWCDSAQKIFFPWQGIGREAAFDRFLQTLQGLAAATSTWQGPPSPTPHFPRTLGFTSFQDTENNPQKDRHNWVICPWLGCEITYHSCSQLQADFGAHLQGDKENLTGSVSTGLDSSQPRTCFVKSLSPGKQKRKHYQGRKWNIVI